MEEKSNIKNEDFFRQEKITVVMTKERKHAHTALVNYLTSMKQPIQHQSQQRKKTNCKSLFNKNIIFYLIDIR